MIFRVVTYTAGLLSFVYDMGVQLLPIGAAKSSVYDIQIAVRSSCCPIVIPSKISAVLCVFDGLSGSGVGVKASSVQILKWCTVWCVRIRWGSCVSWKLP